MWGLFNNTNLDVLGLVYSSACKPKQLGLHINSPSNRHHNCLSICPVSFVSEPSKVVKAQLDEKLFIAISI